MLVRLRDFLALHELPPDRQELVGDFVTFVVIEKDAVALEFDRIAASDDVNEQSSVRQAIERRRGARGKGRLRKAGPHGDEKAESLSERNHCRGDNPGVLARAAGGKEHAVIAKFVGGPGNL